ncbi:PREDICTED: cation/calcium exchanger 5 isoform X2 [Ipomoea nil]|uniref:cation/calcium exchanger 5 isoform X2 n=1 Tax=Ipomoea nil TaxID=35883 RepID=UPI000900921F|nr:PREDICTED: cation/calcium exchanger 5 isoform X2 [Ipomoea nil]
MAFNSAALTTTAISLFLLATVAFFLLHLPPTYSSNHPSKHILLSPHRSLLNSPQPSCRFFSSDESDGLFNYFSIHSCLFRQNPFLSVPFLGLFVLLYFYILITTAQAHFSVVVTKLVAHLRLSPSMGAVTLLALGNGAPDVFASVAAVKGGQPRTGFGAILSAGTFVSAFVVGFVSIYAAPFPVDPAPFVRDVMFYLTAAMFLFYVYLSAEIFLWQAVGFVGFYLFFVGIVFWMDLGEGNRRGNRAEIEMGSIGNGKTHKRMGDCENGKFLGSPEIKNPSSGLLLAYEKISQVWERPVSMLLKLTIPNTSPSGWSRFYQSANIALCPLALLYSCRSFMSLNHPVAFLLSNTHFPLWFVVLCGSSSLALLHYIVEKEPPKSEQMPSILAAFIMSVFWISTAAGELLNCLAVLGVLLKLPSALLGLTVLAWGNSVGDLVADVAVAKAGQPALAMAGCFAGPMFNMLFGLGTALVIQTGDVYPEAYELHFHVSIVVAFVFLLVSLMGSLLVVTWHRFQVPRFWGFCLVGLYSLFMLVSLVIAKFSA